MKRRFLFPAALALAVAVAILWRGVFAQENVVELDLLYTSDIHGHIDRGQATFLNPNFPPPLGGGASAAAYIQRVREEAAAEGRDVLLFDSGDIFQGTPVGMQTQGTAIVEWMNMVRYDALAVGNHDFDKGWENLKRLTELAEFPMLGANVLDSETGEKVPWLGDMLIVEKAGVKIGIVGYCTETTVNMSFAKNIEGLTFAPIHEQLPGHVRELRERGADLVFVLMHSGLPYKPEKEQEYARMRERLAQGALPHWGMNAMELAHTVPGIDAIFGGHTHQGYDQPWHDPMNHTIVFEPYANGSSIGHVTLKVDRKTRTILGYDTHFARGALLTLFEEEIWPDRKFTEVIEEQVAEAEKGLDEVIGETEVLLTRGSPESALMGFVMADAYREELDADFALQNTGGVRADISPGRISERQLLAVSPFENQMVIMELTGEMIRNLMEDRLSGRGSGIFISGGKLRFDLSRPDGDRIVDFTIGGAPVDPQREYKVALTDYLAEGNSGLWRLREVDPGKKLYTGYIDRQVLSQYIRRLGVLRPANDGRWTRVRGAS